MQAAQGELVITLTSEEAEALAKALAAFNAKAASNDARALQAIQAIQQKLKIAREKML